MTVFKKSLLSLGLAVLGFSAVLVMSVLVFMNSLYYDINTVNLGSTARAFIAAIGKDRLVEIFVTNDDKPVNLPVNADGDYRLTLIASSGYVLWDSQVTERMVNHLDRSEIRAALEGREESASRVSISTKTKLIYYAVPVMDSNNNIVGVFRLSIIVPGFWSRLSSIVSSYIVFMVIMILAAFWAIFSFSRSISDSLGRLVKITNEGTALLPETAI
jgi:two-component system phosphate regulon sensor histidine kinase PhoR